MPVTASASSRTFLVQVMTVYAVLVCPGLAKSCNFSRFLLMTHNTFSDFIHFMTLMIEFDIMFKFDDIRGKGILGKQGYYK